MSDDKSESKKEQVDRELIELLNELRVALPGVQFIFGFLLTVPFSQRFAEVDRDQRATYLLILIALTLSSLLLIAPASQHRILFRQQDKDDLLIRSTRYARFGLTALLCALALSLFFVLDLVYSGVLASVVGAAALLIGTWWWLVLPTLRRKAIE